MENAIVVVFSVTVGLVDAWALRKAIAESWHHVLCPLFTIEHAGVEHGLSDCSVGVEVVLVSLATIGVIWFTIAFLLYSLLKGGA